MMKAYIDHLQQCLLDGCYEQLRGVVLRRRAAIGDDELAQTLSGGVRRQIEVAVRLPVSCCERSSFDLSSSSDALRRRAAADRGRCHTASLML